MTKRQREAALWLREVGKASRTTLKRHGFSERTMEALEKVGAAEVTGHGVQSLPVWRAPDFPLVPDLEFLRATQPEPKDDEQRRSVEALESLGARDELICRFYRRAWVIEHNDQLNHYGATTLGAIDGGAERTTCERLGIDRATLKAARERLRIAQEIREERSEIAAHTAALMGEGRP